MCEFDFLLKKAIRTTAQEQKSNSSLLSFVSALPKALKGKWLAWGQGATVNGKLKFRERFNRFLIF